MHLFLLAGQSNMAGRGAVEPHDVVPHPRIWMLDRNLQWVPAVDPVHFDKPTAGVGPGRSFALALVERDPNVVIGLIPAAVGGSSVAQWEPGAWHDQTGSPPYDDALQRVRAAIPSGDLKAILWHQGESDASADAAPLYAGRLAGLIDRFRRDLDDSELPFLIGGLGCFEARSWDRSTVVVDSVQRMLAVAVPHVAFVASEGLGHRGDTLHFSSAAARDLGRRYAAAYLSLRGERVPVIAPPSACAR